MPFSSHHSMAIWRSASSILFAAIAQQRILEITKRAGAADGVLQFVAQPLRLDGLGELAHDVPLVDSVFCGQLADTPECVNQASVQVDVSTKLVSGLAYRRGSKQQRLGCHAWRIFHGLDGQIESRSPAIH